MSPEIVKLLLEVFGPAAVTLVLLVAAINRLWPQVIQDQEQTREANTALVDAIGQIATQHTRSMTVVIEAINKMEDRLTSQHNRFQDELDRKSKMSDQRHAEYLRAFDRVNKSLESVASRLNGVK